MELGVSVGQIFGPVLGIKDKNLPGYVFDICIQIEYDFLAGLTDFMTLGFSGELLKTRMVREYGVSLVVAGKIEGVYFDVYVDRAKYLLRLGSDNII